MCHLKNAQCGKRVPADRGTKLATGETLDQNEKSESIRCRRAIDGTF
jgi:hypothetical protein